MHDIDFDDELCDWCNGDGGYYLQEDNPEGLALIPRDRLTEAEREFVDQHLGYEYGEDDPYEAESFLDDPYDEEDEC